MSTIRIGGLEENGVYTSDQLKELERSNRIFRLRSSKTGLRDYLQGNEIYSLEKDGEGKLKVKERIVLGRLYGVEQRI